MRGYRKALKRVFLFIMRKIEEELDNYLRNPWDKVRYDDFHEIYYLLYEGRCWSYSNRRNLIKAKSKILNG